MKTAIAIPARYGSSRFPGKPLAKIGGRTMLERVVALAQSAINDIDDAFVFVTTEDKRIDDHAKTLDVPCIITPPSCRTGSDRVLSALRQLDNWPDFVINLQGDAPFTPLPAINALIKAFHTKEFLEVVTPVHQLSWNDLDRLRAAKKETPFSGTTVVVNKKGRALWFSKNILPAIRDEDIMREKTKISPVYQHMGLYGFRTDILEKFCELPQSPYEKIEGLEQLRMLENGIRIQAVKIGLETGLMQSGIDTAEDLKRAEKILAEHGDDFP